MKIDIYNTDKKYQIIYADPPWEYKQKQMNFQHYDKGKKYINDVTEHYSTMSLSKLKDLHIEKITDKDCLLYMWATSPNLDIAIELGKAWGFEFKTVAFVWDKQRTNYGYISTRARTRDRKIAPRPCRGIAMPIASAVESEVRGSSRIRTTSIPGPHSTVAHNDFRIHAASC
jgi:hypothetical protein